MEANKPVTLYTRLRAVHKRGQLLNMLSGFFSFSKWVILLFLAGFAVDWLIHMPSAVRILFLLLLGVVSLYRAWRNGWRFFRSFSMAHAALKVEDHYSNLDSLLVSGVQLSERKTTPGTSEAMSELTIKRSEDAASPVSPKAVVPFAGLRKPAVAPILLCMVLGGVAAMNPDLLMAGMARIFTPWQAVTYPTRTYIKLANSELVVQEGKSIVIRALVSGEIPEHATLSMRTGTGKPHRRKLPVSDKSCEYRVASAFRSFDFSIRAGDAETDWHTVRVISSPRVAETKIRLVYPEYMSRDPETMEAMTLVVPEGATIEWDLKLDTPVSSAAFNIEGTESIPLDLGEDGATLRHTMTANASGAYSFSMVEKAHRFSFDGARHYLQVAPDQPPQIECMSPRKDLFATKGRELSFAYRGRDDHGLGDSNIIYRRNDLPEKSVPFSPEISEGRSVSEIEWDYRTSVKDVEIGDTITFTIEVSDRYPPPAGPHTVRSESRTVSFLSREDYLEKVDEQKHRLLSQLRAVYRQERAAHEVIRDIDPSDDAFEQTCFLESSRQEILMERVELLTSGITELIADLTANNIKEKKEYEGLEELKSSLSQIAGGEIAKAASTLRDLGSMADRDAPAVAAVADIINNAARELGSLVLQLGVNEAMEVFAMELHVIARSQSALRVKTVDSDGEMSGLSDGQKALAQWVDRLLRELGGKRDYSRAPLTIVRLARMVKDLRAAGLDVLMTNAAVMLSAGNAAEASILQEKIIALLFDLECNIRVGAEYEALLNARELFTAGINMLNQAAMKNSALSAENIANDVTAMNRNVRLLIIPPVPAPELGLLTENPGIQPNLKGKLSSLRDSLLKAAASLSSGDQKNFLSMQPDMVALLEELNKIITVRLDEVTKVARYAGLSGASMERASLIRELFASQMRLTEKTEDADYDETSAAYLAPSQLQLSKEVLKMRNRLLRTNKGESASRAVAPMLKMLEESSAAMIKAAPVLEADKRAEAIECQDEALNALQTAMGFSSQESKGWLGLANLLMTTEGIALPAKYMKYVVDEQRDLIEDTKKSTPESRKELVKIQNNLAAAVYDVSVLLEGTGSALDFEQAMIFAGSDMGLSAQQLESGDIAAATKAQALAVVSVNDLYEQFHTYEKQFYYFAGVMEFLLQMHTEGVVIIDKLDVLTRQMAETEDGEAKPDRDAMARLIADAISFSTVMYRATGRDGYKQTLTLLSDADAKSKAGDADACMGAIISSGDRLKESMEDLRELMEKVAYIPSVEPIEAPKEYNDMLDMVNLVLKEKKLATLVYSSAKDKLPGLASHIDELEEEAGDLIQETSQHACVLESAKCITEARGYLEQSERNAAFSSLEKSKTLMRHCILEYALYYVEIKRPRGARRKKKGKSGIVKMFKMPDKIRPAYDKDWGGVEGEDPESGRSEWEVLGRRNRAALNENFVRELPLEYREFLKDYYERLAQ